MTDTTYYLAIDIGASSGRHVLGHVEDGRIVLEEVHRFDNIQQRRRGHDCWDVDMLWRNVLAGIQKCGELGKVPASLGIDTWGVDFVLLDGAGKRIGDAVAYRDARTQSVAQAVDERIGVSALYEKTGIQRQEFNTVYQFAALAQEHPEELERAEREVGFGELAEMARAEEERAGGMPAPRVNVNDDRFLAPDSMIEEIKAACREGGQPEPETTGALMRCVYESLTSCYAQTIAELSQLTGHTYTSMNVVGGGCQDAYLNELTARACGMPVHAGPVEGTSLGNLMVQMIEGGEFADLQEARAAIRRSFDVKVHEPR